MKKYRLSAMVMSLIMFITLVSCSNQNEDPQEYKPTKEVVLEVETVPEYIVPDVTGMTPLEAAEKLEKTGFTNIKNNISDSSELEKYRWEVISQSVSSGTRLEFDNPIILECRKYVNFYLDLQSEDNLFFSKYDVDVSLDGKNIGSISNGSNFTYLIEIPEGNHEITISKTGDSSISAVKSVDLDDNTTYQCIIAHDKDSIELKKQNISQGVSGSELIMPDVYKKILSDALKELKEIGFINISTYADDDVILSDGNWMVVEQSKAVGESFDKTEKIELKCIKLSDYFEREYVGKTLYEAKEKADSEGFPLKVMEHGSFDSVSIEGSKEWLESWKVVSASKTDTKTAYLKVKKIQKETTTQTTTTLTTTTATTTKSALVTTAKKIATTVPLKVYLDPELRIDYPRPTGNPVLKKGDSGDEIGWLQTALNIVLKTNDTVDCSFGSGTMSSVMEFQTRAGLQADGSVGPKTIEKIVEIATGRSTLPVITTTRIIITTAKIYTTTTVYTTAQQNNDYVPPRNNSSSGGGSYVCNTNTKKFHSSGCSSVSSMNESNKYYVSSRDEAISQGYETCKRCNP